jgi:ATP/maltotriose-dependent transcriptional regulator MalT
LLRSRPRLRKPVLSDWDLARTAVEVLLYLGRAAEALPLLDTWEGYLDRLDLRIPMAEWVLLRAAVDQARGRKEQAQEKLLLGLKLCAEIGALGLPMGLRPWLRPIALACVSHLPTEADAKVLLEQLSEIEAPSMKSNASVSENLSDREMEVLRAMRDGKSNKEIAITLFVAPSTVKTHLKNIFAKMGVSNRTRAVTLAEEAGILH